MGISPTGKKVEFAGMHIGRIEEGKIAKTGIKEELET
jgi:predicted ester cyclase